MNENCLNHHFYSNHHQLLMRVLGESRVWKGRVWKLLRGKLSAAPCQIFIKSMPLESPTIITIITSLLTDTCTYSSWGLFISPLKALHWRFRIDLLLWTTCCLAQFELSCLTGFAALSQNFPFSAPISSLAGGNQLIFNVKSEWIPKKRKVFWETNTIHFWGGVGGGVFLNWN